jgi:hypothetical protein
LLLAQISAATRIFSANISHNFLRNVERKDFFGQQENIILKNIKKHSYCLHLQQHVDFYYKNWSRVTC